MKDGYFLPVDETKRPNDDAIHPLAKYHYFQDGKSLCNSYYMDTDDFETDIPEGDIIATPMLACKKCYGKRRTMLKRARSYM